LRQELAEGLWGGFDASGTSGGDYLVEGRVFHTAFTFFMAAAWR
jgi:hypothetical protein